MKGRPLRRAVQPTTSTSAARGSWSRARCQLRQSTAQTSALPSATATIEARCAAVSMRSEKMARLCAGRVEIARQRHDARHGIEAVVGEAFVADEIEGENGAAIGGRLGMPSATCEPRAASGSRWNKARLARLRCRHSSAGRRRRHAAQAPPPSAPSRSAPATAPDVSTASESRVRLMAASPDRVRSPCPRRCGCRRERPAARHCGARVFPARRCRHVAGARANPPIPHRWRRGLRASHTWEGRRWMGSSRHLRKQREKRKPENDQAEITLAGSFLGRLGRNRRGAEAGQRCAP